MTPDLLAALSTSNVLMFGAVEVALPGYTLRLLNGAGTLTIGGNTFVGNDATYGALGSIRDLTDGIGDEAPALSIEFLPPSATAAATLAAATMQGSVVRVMLGAIDRATGLVISDPVQLFLGALDVPTLSWDEKSRTIDYEVRSVFERFFATEEGQRLSDSFHQWVWSGELGMQFVTGVTEKVYWGVEAPVSTGVHVVTGGSYGSVGNFGQFGPTYQS